MGMNQKFWENLNAIVYSVLGDLPDQAFIMDQPTPKGRFIQEPPKSHLGFG